MDYCILSGVLLGVVTSFILIHHGTCVTVERVQRVTVAVGSLPCGAVGLNSDD